MTGRRAEVRSTRRIVLSASLLAVAALLWAVAAPATPAVAQVSRVADATGWSAASVTATPTSNLGDGQRISINVKNSNPLFIIELAEAQVCRAGVTYTSSTGLTPASDFQQGGANCPQVAVSTSASGIVVDSYVNPDAASPNGETFRMAVGTGNTSWTNQFTGKPASLTCDQDHPCSLVVELNALELDSSGHVIQPLSWRPFVLPLTYIDSNPITGCGGPAKGILSSSGSDSLEEAWIGWSLAACRTPGQVGALTSMSFTGEGNAISSFVSGVTDIAYTGAGYDPDTKMAPTDAETKRPAVAVPIGLNAVVLGLGGGFIDESANRFRPYDQQPELTVPELTTLLAGGPAGAIQSHLNDIYLRNPELGTPGMFTIQNGAILLSAPSDAEVTSWLATRYVASLDGPDWVVPDLPLYGDDAGKPRGIDADLALASPSYNNAITLLTGRPALQKAEESLDNTGGGTWALTDLTAADALGLVPTQIQNAAGQFVAPTAESMAAAVAGMDKTSAGTLVPDPNQTVGYPLTYVEYMLVPTQPLADSENVCRTDSQALLTKWLSYVTGAGQKNLPAGLVPLTPDLAAQAKAAIAQVGATRAAKPCTKPTSPGAPGGPGGAPGSGVGASTGAGSFGAEVVDTGAGSGGALGSPALVGANKASHRPTALVVLTNPPAPRYGGESLPSALATLVALVGLILLMGSAAAWSSGWRPQLRRSSSTSDEPPP